MYVLLLLLSAISTAVGLFAVGIGLMPYELSLGNALVVAGTVAIVGGMVLFGLAMAVRQLRRIADALASRPVPARRPAMADGADRQAPASRGGYPPRSAPDMRDARADMRAAEPRPPAPPVEPPDDGPPERQRPTIFGSARASGEPPIVEEHEDVPLAPGRGPAPPVTRGAPPRAEPPAEPRPTPADITARLSNLAATPPRPAARPEPQRAASEPRRPACWSGRISSGCARHSARWVSGSPSRAIRCSW